MLIIRLTGRGLRRLPQSGLWERLLQGGGRADDPSILTDQEQSATAARAARSAVLMRRLNTAVGAVILHAVPGSASVTVSRAAPIQAIIPPSTLAPS